MPNHKSSCFQQKLKKVMFYVKSNKFPGHSIETYMLLKVHYQLQSVKIYFDSVKAANLEIGVAKV
jgi:hypothetical protein